MHSMQSINTHWECNTKAPQKTFAHARCYVPRWGVLRYPSHAYCRILQQACNVSCTASHTPMHLIWSSTFVPTPAKICYSGEPCLQQKASQRPWGSLSPVQRRRACTDTHACLQQSISTLVGQLLAIGRRYVLATVGRSQPLDQLQVLFCALRNTERRCSFHRLHHNHLSEARGL